MDNAAGMDGAQASGLNLISWRAHLLITWNCWQAFHNSQWWKEEMKDMEDMYKSNQDNDHRSEAGGPVDTIHTSLAMEIMFLAVSNDDSIT